jgi:hypothetical protein
MARPYGLYRYYHQDGSSRDWAIRDNHDGTITRRYGKTGSRLAATTSHSYNTVLEMDGLVKKKCGKGYQYIGVHYIDDDGKPSKEEAPPTHNKPVVLEPFIHWRVRYPSSLYRDGGNPLFVNYISTISGLLAVFSKTGPESTGWIRAFLARQASILEGGTIAGQLSKSDGVIPLLFLMALKKSQHETFINIYISADNGDDISHKLTEETQALAFFGESSANVRKIAEETGLLPKVHSIRDIQPEIARLYF